MNILKTNVLDVSGKQGNYHKKKQFKWGYDINLSKTLSNCGITSKGRHQNDTQKRYVCLTAIVKVRIPLYPTSANQSFLYEKIIELKNSGKGYRKIAYWLNDSGYKTPKGHSFKNTHVFSILKKRRLRDEKYGQVPDIKIRDVHIKIKR